MVEGAKRRAEDAPDAPDPKRAMLAKALEAVKNKARDAVVRAQVVASQSKPLNRAPVMAAAPTTPATMTLQQSVQARMAKMRQQGVVGGTASPMPPQALIQPPQDPRAAASAAERLRLLKERVEGKLSKVAVQQESQQQPQNVTMTSDGRFIDATTGEEVEVKRREAMFSVNKRIEGAGGDAPVAEETEAEVEEDVSEFVDTRLVGAKAARRKPRNLKFRDRGFHMEYAQRLRKRAEVERLQQEIEYRSAKVKLAEGAVSSSLLTAAKPTLKTRGTPTIEWWDKIIVPKCKTMDEAEQIKEFPAIANLIEHPILIQPYKPHSTKPMPVMRTRKELEKERRVRRREDHLEKQERIRLHLDPPPPPKLKLSNLMRLLANDAVQDPTKMEAEVRKQVVERQDKHLKANEQRKLTKEERSAKRDKKLQEDTKYEIHSAAFWVKDLTHNLNKKKVDVNAEQYKLTGAVVTSPISNLVVVEGGPKNVAKYVRLMMHRIKWNLKSRGDYDDEMNDYDDVDDDDDDLYATKRVELVWKGTAKARRFTKWIFRKVEGDSEARRWLRDYDAENLWDLVLTTGAQVAQDE